MHLIDKLIADRGTIDAEAVRLWMGSDGFDVCSSELARLLGLTTHTVQCWRRESGPRPRHLRARLIEAEIMLREQRRQGRRTRRAASPAPA